MAYSTYDTVSVGRHQVKVPRVRARLLRALVARQGCLVLHEILLAETFGGWMPADPLACLRVHVARLRRDLDQVGVAVYVKHGVGYTIRVGKRKGAGRRKLV